MPQQWGHHEKGPALSGISEAGSAFYSCRGVLFEGQLSAIMLPNTRDYSTQTIHISGDNEAQKSNHTNCPTYTLYPLFNLGYIGPFEPFWESFSLTALLKTGFLP